MPPPLAKISNRILTSTSLQSESKPATPSGEHITEDLSFHVVFLRSQARHLLFPICCIRSEFQFNFMRDQKCHPGWPIYPSFRIPFASFRIPLPVSKYHLPVSEYHSQFQNTTRQFPNTTPSFRIPLSSFRIPLSSFRIPPPVSES